MTLYTKRFLHLLRWEINKVHAELAFWLFSNRSQFVKNKTDFRFSSFSQLNGRKVIFSYSEFIWGEENLKFIKVGQWSVKSSSIIPALKIKGLLIQIWSSAVGLPLELPGGNLVALLIVDIKFIEKRVEVRLSVSGLSVESRSTLKSPVRMTQLLFLLLFED